AANLEAAVEAALADVRSANEDFELLKEAATQTAEALRSEAPPTARGVEPAAELLEWMHADNFVFLGYREYDLATNGDGKQYLDANRETGLGGRREQTSTSRPLTELGHQQIDTPNPRK